MNSKRLSKDEEKVMLRKLYAAEVQANKNTKSHTAVPAEAALPVVSHYVDCDQSQCRCDTRKSDHTSELQQIAKQSVGRARSSVEQKSSEPVSTQQHQKPKEQQPKPQAKEQVKKEQPKEEQTKKERTKEQTRDEQTQKAKDQTKKERTLSSKESQKPAEEQKKALKDSKSQQQPQKQTSSSSSSDISKTQQEASKSTSTTTAKPLPSSSSSTASSSSIHSFENTRGQVLAGKHTVVAEEVFQVSAYDYEVKLDTAAIAELEEKVFKGRDSEKLLDLNQLPTSEDKLWEPADHQQTRAVLFVRLISLLQGRTGVRPQIVQFITSLLNARVYMHVSSLQSLLPFFLPSCNLPCIFEHANTSFDKTGLKGPGLTQNDATALVSGVVVNSALLAFGIHALQVGLNLADAVGALSLEATQASLSPFSLITNDVSRPHRSLITVSTHIRLLTEGSSRISSNEQQVDPECVRDIPSIHGAARDALALGLTTSRIELNSAEASQVSNENHGKFHAQPIVAVMRSVLTSVHGVIHASEARQALVSKLAGEMDSVDGEEKRPADNLSDAQVVSVFLPTITNMLNKLKTETAKSSEFLTKLSDGANSEVTARLAAKEEREREIKAQREQAAAAQREQAAAAKGEVEKPLDEKANKKREEKLRKQAEKANEKAKKKGTQTAIKLGMGTATVLQYIKDLRVLNPFNNQELQSFLETLLTTSNQICKPKIPRGTRDTSPTQMVIREQCFAKIKEVFLSHGAVGIDTPLFERKETLMGKYGEDSKLIYELADQGGEMLALRYDLTVPLARYLAVHQVTNLKRYHIARVYRRDNPAMNRGRYREFYQCDYDVAGNYPTMVPDADVLKVVCDILEALDLQFKVKLNHRCILDSLMELCGVPAKSFRPICSAIDKLDKETWETVKDEMVNQKGLSESSADKLGKYVTLPPGQPAEMLATLRADSAFVSLPKAKQALDDLELLFRFLKCFGCLHRISFDLSLARGLDYYTGVIYEAVLTDTGRVGSIAAGGRYDNLVGMFSAKPVPAVGVSVGIERLLSILEEREEKKGVRESHTEVLVASIGNGMLVSRLKVARELWQAHIPTELLYDENPKPKKQLDYALEHKIPFVIFIGETELKEGVVKVKDMAIREEVVVKNEELPAKLKSMIAAAALRPPETATEVADKAEAGH